MKQIVLLAFFVLVLTPCLSHADTITFNGLTGPNVAPMPNPYIEGNFRVIPTLGSWFQGQMFGNPTPSIFSDSATGVIDVMLNGGGIFTFSQVDLADAGFVGGTEFTIQGRLGSSIVFSTSGSLDPDFTTILSPNVMASIDDLRITMTRDLFSYNVDNIGVTPGAF